MSEDVDIWMEKADEVFERIRKQNPEKVKGICKESFKAGFVWGGKDMAQYVKKSEL